MRHEKYRQIIAKGPAGLRSILAGILLAIVLLTAPPAVQAAGSLSLYTSEDLAQQHCPRDVVVWLNLPTRVYHLKGQRWYGRTKNGAYVCKTEADAVGARGSLNGQ